VVDGATATQYGWVLSHLTSWHVCRVRSCAVPFGRVAEGVKPLPYGHSGLWRWEQAPTVRMNLGPSDQLEKLWGTVLCRPIWARGGRGQAPSLRTIRALAVGVNSNRTDEPWSIRLVGKFVGIGFVPFHLGVWRKGSSPFPTNDPGFGGGRAR